jgi:D-lactate dehydrogenase
MDVFFFEAFTEEVEAIKRFLPERIKAEFTWKTIQEYDPAEPPAPVISLRTQSIIPAQWSRDLCGILTRSTGYDHLIRYRQLTGTDVACGYLPLYCHRAVAEQALLLWMALLRKLPRQVTSFASFHRDGLTGTEAAGKTLLVVGVGNIGSEIVKIGQGLGMTVFGVDLEHKHDFVDYVTIEEGLPHADIVVCAMNLTQDNQGYFNCKTFAQTRRGVLFVNVARGELSPALDLQQMLESGQLGGIGLDVYNYESELAVSLRCGAVSTNEEVQAIEALAKRQDVIFTPHNAFNTYESVRRKAEQSVQQVENILKHQAFLWPIPQ